MQNTGGTGVYPNESIRPTDEPPMFVGRDMMAEANEARARETAEAEEKGEHYFLTIIGYKVDPTTQGTLVRLDADNLRLTPNTGCFICEQTYHRGMDMHCPGEPVG